MTKASAPTRVFQNEQKPNPAQNLKKSSWHQRCHELRSILGSSHFREWSVKGPSTDTTEIYFLPSSYLKSSLVSRFSSSFKPHQIQLLDILVKLFSQYVGLRIKINTARFSNNTRTKNNQILFFLRWHLFSWLYFLQFLDR